MVAVIADLITFIRARLDEDEGLANAAAKEQLYNVGGVLAKANWRSDGDGYVSTIGRVEGCWDETLWPSDRPGYVERRMPGYVADHIARHDPARVLREVEAKRRILDEVLHEIDFLDHQVQMEFGTGPMPDYAEATVLLVKLLAHPYSDHPDHRQEWAP
jgi:hypothetical protein